MDDSRGIKRGKCKTCSCDLFQPVKGTSCVCGHPPGKHERVSQASPSASVNGAAVAGAFPAELQDSDSVPEAAAQFPQCSHPGCKNDAYSDLNLKKQFAFCKDHLTDGQDDVYSDDDQDTCAIEECKKPKFVDPSGTVHECCSYTHAMELARRKIVRQMKAVKGVTHCLLPGCNKPNWPFKNYCGLSHAKQGKARGLVPPAQSQQGPKDLTHCKLPGCMRPKRVEAGKIFDYCGKTHADEAKRKQPQGPKTSEMCLLVGCYMPKSKDSDGTVHPYCSKAHAEKAKSGASNKSIAKDDTMCIIPECIRPKYKDPSTGEEFDCCGKGHAAMAKARNIQPILTSKSDIKKFLDKCSGLTVVKLEENDHAKPPNGILYQKFIAARNSLPEDCRTTCLAFHGTSETNIPSICANGYDPTRRGQSAGQAHGAGEYFATSPGIPMGYCNGGKKILLNELLLGQVNTHHTQHGDIVVMKNPAHDLPRFIVTFK